MSVEEEMEEDEKEGNASLICPIRFRDLLPQKLTSGHQHWIGFPKISEEVLFRNAHNRFLHAEGQAWLVIRCLELGKKFGCLRMPLAPCTKSNHIP
jgi:hypothetical protein